MPAGHRPAQRIEGISDEADEGREKDEMPHHAPSPRFSARQPRRQASRRLQGFPTSRLAIGQRYALRCSEEERVEAPYGADAWLIEGRGVFGYLSILSIP